MPIWYEWNWGYPELDPDPSPHVSFSAVPLGGVRPVNVTFSDLSTNTPTSWEWEFGEGGTSTTQNPSYTYDHHGTYSIKLTAHNAYGSGAAEAVDYITVDPEYPAIVAGISGYCVAEPIHWPPMGDQPATIQFADTSTNHPTSWLWDFGDGETSTQQNPIHSYAGGVIIIGSSIQYTVTLTASNYDWTDTLVWPNFVTVLVHEPGVSFSATPLSGMWYYGQPVTIQFTETSSNVPVSWFWDFGDGTTSTEQNPSHSYNSVGKYTVRLDATNIHGTGTLTKVEYISILSPGGPDPSGMRYTEYYLYSDKAWEMAPSGVSSFNLAHAVQQNAPVIVTASGYETTDSTQPWGQVRGTGKYNKVGYGYFTLLDNGQYDSNALEFALHPDSSGKIAFNGTLRENVYIEYEAGPSGYYIMDTIDYNPIRAEVGGGFVHFSETTAPAYLYLAASQSEIRAEGSRGCKFTATVYDEDFDRVPEQTIVFEIQNLLPALDASGAWSELGYLVTSTTGTGVLSDASGQMIELSEVTSRRGEVTTRYTANDIKTGITQVKAYVLGASGVYDTARVAQYYLNQEPFILDLSLLDTLDYLT